MTVRELIDLLVKMPEDAPVMIHHDLVGDEHETVSVVYDGSTVTIREID